MLGNVSIFHQKLGDICNGSGFVFFRVVLIMALFDNAWELACFVLTLLNTLPREIKADLSRVTAG